MFVNTSVMLYTSNSAELAWVRTRAAYWGNEMLLFFIVTSCKIFFFSQHNVLNWYIFLLWQGILHSEDRRVAKSPLCCFGLWAIHGVEWRWIHAIHMTCFLLLHDVGKDHKHMVLKRLVCLCDCNWTCIADL